MKTRKKITGILVLFPLILASILTDVRGADHLAEDPEEGGTPCDWMTADGKIAGESARFDFRFAGPVNFEKGAAYSVFLDTDRDRDTGFKGSSGEFPVGADYLVQGATIFQYSGTGTDWSWTQQGTPQFEINENELLLTVALSQIGNPTGPIDFFCFGDNEAPGVDGTKPDVMPDGAFSNGSKLTLKP